MTHVTEQVLIELAQTLRGEFTQQVTALQQELSVQITEAHNRTAGMSREEVQALISEAVPQPTPGLSVEDVEALIKVAVDGLPTSPPGLTVSEVEQIIAEALPAGQPAPEPGLTREEVEAMIAGFPAYDDDEIKKRVLRLRVFVDGLADRIGASRMEG